LPVQILDFARLIKQKLPLLAINKDQINKLKLQTLIL